MKLGNNPFGKVAGISGAFRSVLIAAVLFCQPLSLQAAENVIVASATEQSRVAAVSEKILVRASSTVLV